MFKKIIVGIVLFSAVHVQPADVSTSRLQKIKLRLEQARDNTMFWARTHKRELKWVAGGSATVLAGLLAYRYLPRNSGSSSSAADNYQPLTSPASLPAASGVPAKAPAKAAAVTGRVAEAMKAFQPATTAASATGTVRGQRLSSPVAQAAASAVPAAAARSVMSPSVIHPAVHLRPATDTSPGDIAISSAPASATQIRNPGAFPLV